MPTYHMPNTVCDKCSKTIYVDESCYGVGDWEGATLCPDCFAALNTMSASRPTTGLKDSAIALDSRRIARLLHNLQFHSGVFGIMSEAQQEEYSDVQRMIADYHKGKQDAS
jgi:hypothetical protein